MANKRAGRTRLDRAFYKLDRERLWNEQGRVCYYCKHSLRRNELTTDHVVPISKNGATTIDNCVVACYACNHKKADMSVEEFVPDELNWMERMVYDGLLQLEMQTRRVEYTFANNTKGSFNKWNRYWEKQGRFHSRAIRKPTHELSDLLK